MLIIFLFLNIRNQQVFLTVTVISYILRQNYVQYIIQSQLYLCKDLKGLEG